MAKIWREAIQLLRASETAGARRAHGTVKQDKSNARALSLSSLFVLRSCCGHSCALLLSLSLSHFLLLSGVAVGRCHVFCSALFALCVMAAESICETRFVSMVDDDDESVSRISHFAFASQSRRMAARSGHRCRRRCQADGYSSMAAPQHTVCCRRQIMAVFAVLRFVLSLSYSR